MKSQFLAALALVLMGALGGAIHPALAQTPFGTILGTVTDSTGAVLPGAAITVTHVSTKIKYETVTDDVGNYAVRSLPPGRYDVAAQLSGFKAELVKDLLLEVEKKARVDFTLTVGSVAEKVEVIAAVPLVDTDSSTVGSVVENKKIVDFPLNGRNFLQLATLAPAVLQTPVGIALGGAVTSNSIGGGRISGTGLLMDGVDFSTVNTNGPSVQPSPDLIQEFKVQTTTMNAEFARAAAINLVTRQGTNELHGTLYEFFRNQVLDATPFFSNRAGATKPPIRFNQFGVTAGGPIVIPRLYDGRTRTFFFVSYEGVRNYSSTTTLANLPSPTFLKGDFSSLTTPIKDPSTGNPFPGNLIPQERISRFAAKYAPFVPAPNLSTGQIPGANFNRSTRTAIDINPFSIRMDEKIAKGVLWGRYQRVFSLTRSDDLTPLWDRVAASQAQNLILGGNYTFSPTLINEARVSYNRLFAYNRGVVADKGVNYAGDVLGLKNLAVRDGLYAFPQVQISGFATFGGGGLAGSVLTQTVNTYDYVDNLTYSKSRHTLKAGANVRRVQFTLGDGQVQNGILSFVGGFTGNPVGDFILGNPLTGVLGWGSNGELALSTQYGLFLQDDWRVTPRLSLNYGLRYDYFSREVTPNDRQGIFDPSFPGGRLLLANSADYVVPGVGLIKGSGPPLVSRGMIDPDVNNLAPRIGFALRPFNSNKTAIRGGYGVFYDAPISNEQGLSRYVPPFFFQQTIVSSAVTPTLSTDTLFPVPATFPGGGAGSRSRTQRIPYLQQWSFNIQRELAPNWLVEMGYLGAKGAKLLTRQPINQAALGPGPILDRVPFKNFTTAFLVSDSLASSDYHAFMGKVEKRLSAGLSFLASYTFGKMIDTVSASVPPLGFTLQPQNSRCLSCERALSDLDARHRLVLSYTYELPFGGGRRFASGVSGALNQVIGGWQLTGITSFQSGAPVNVTVPGDNANVGTGLQRPDLRGPVARMDFRKTGFAYDISPFARPASGSFGNAGRNIVRGPGINNFDFGLYKNFYVDKEQKRSVQFRMEMFNLFNHAQFTQPGGAFGTAQFGRFLGTRPPRQIQMALKVYY